jgi:hypothetical protein
LLSAVGVDGRAKPGCWQSLAWSRLLSVVKGARFELARGYPQRAFQVCGVEFSAVRERPEMRLTRPPLARGGSTDLTFRSCDKERSQRVIPKPATRDSERWASAFGVSQPGGVKWPGVLLTWMLK